MLSTRVVPVAARTVLCPVGFIVVGCATAPPATLPADPSIVAPPGLPSDEHAVVERAYRDFWRITWNSTTERDGVWDAEVRRVAGQELADQITSRAREQLAGGIRLYGAVVARVSSVQITGGQASVQDCQDASRAGQADLASGNPKNVGIARNLVHATLTKGPDAVWRVDRIEFPGGEC
ncbi:hypothetical protein [Saccharopolyspora elongata]|uniref:Lipoprotein n=1 Tax=Saccharopolyspora elongata TaxID=2530387 RepID=A0A4R4YA41_9PSEU|nr:hypothetical protein [Saccharopolyspora elongata]TDD41375.1 hypothetical protein E1288_32885 [Saccharopolyspora elongata]